LRARKHIRDKAEKSVGGTQNLAKRKTGNRTGCTRTSKRGKKEGPPLTEEPIKERCKNRPLGGVVAGRAKVYNTKKGQWEKKKHGD